MLNNDQTKLKIVKFFYPLAVRYWEKWSHLYRFLFERKYRKYKLEKELSLKIVESNLASLSWKRDGIKQLWDSCGLPNKVQYILNEIKDGKEQPNLALDCDDFSIWAANTITSKYRPRIYTFAWMNDDGKLEGHAMCLCTDINGRIFHIGNWGTSRAFDTLKEMCEDICLRRRATPVGWSLFTKDLKLIKCGSGLPNTSIK